jgi:hypothetical protein
MKVGDEELVLFYELLGQLVDFVVDEQSQKGQKNLRNRNIILTENTDCAENFFELLIEKEWH